MCRQGRVFAVWTVLKTYGPITSPSPVRPVVPITHMASTTLAAGSPSAPHSPISEYVRRNALMGSSRVISTTCVSLTAVQIYGETAFPKPARLLLSTVLSGTMLTTKPTSAWCHSTAL